MHNVFGSELPGWTSMAFDASGQTHIVYYEFNSGDLKYVTDGTLFKEQVKLFGDVAPYCAMAFDAQGNRHCCYVQTETYDLYYANDVSGHWIRRQVEGGENIEAVTLDMAIDSKGSPTSAITNGRAETCVT